MNERHRVYAYITHQDRLLVFTQPNAPEAGIQVPAGGVRDGEEPAAAALREAMEETGLIGLRLAAFLGNDSRDMRDFGLEELQHRWFYHVVCEGAPPERWSHGEYDDAGKLVHPFDFFWASLPDDLPGLVKGYDDFIPDLLGQKSREYELPVILS